MKHHRLTLRLALFALAVLEPVIGPGRLGAQGIAAIGGRLVARASRAPIEGAHMTVLGTGLSTWTDSAGRFTFASVPAGVRVVQARIVGYSVGSWIIQLNDGQAFSQELEMEAHAVEVAGVTVTAHADEGWRSEAGFERRRQHAQGYFFTRDDILSRRVPTIADLLRTVPGVFTSCRGNNCQVMLGRSIERRCAAEYFLDGFPATFATGPSFPVNQIRGVEIYRDITEVPVDFQRPNMRCGVIAIWTSEPGAPLADH
jgi:carboxypeptidase family protein/TonB-dependent receptor-like protein